MAGNEPDGAAKPRELKPAEFAAVRDWPGFFRAVLGKPPRDTLLKALELFEKESPMESAGAKLAVDLGCGEGRDTLELLRRGWRVVAIDAHPMAFELMLPRVLADEQTRLQVVRAEFQDAQWPPCRLINASFALPFCDRAHFTAVWERIVDALPRGGRFCGQLFGDRDTWAALPDRTHHTRAEAERLLREFVLEQLVEEERDGEDVGGKPKHWHVFHVVARKR